MKSNLFNQQKLLLVFGIFTLLSSFIFAGTTGKIAGTITDKETGEPIIGANIIIEGTYAGAAADIDGYYFINNIAPGTYNCIVSAMGYHKVTITKVVVKIDLSTKLDVELTSAAIDLGEDVVVVAERPQVVMDLTSSSATVSADEINMMPVESVGQIVNLQAGVMDGHFRGGRSGEVSYLVDGVAVTDAYNGGMSVEVENSAIREIEVISGTFNAEYGQAMSGIVNIVTQEGSQNFDASATAYVGTYLTSESDVFRNLDGIQTDGVKDFQFSLSGPILKNLTFFATGRYVDNGGHLYGERVYNTTDTERWLPTGIASYEEYFEHLNPNNPEELIDWTSKQIEDGKAEYVSMNQSERKSFNAKIAYSLPDWKFTYSLLWGDNWNQYYDHYWSWTPDGILNNYDTDIVHSFHINYFPSNSTYTSLKFSLNEHSYENYLYENPYDSRYMDPKIGQTISSNTFRQGGTQGDRFNRKTKTFIAQWSLNSQISKEHKIGIGVETRIHEMSTHWRTIIDLEPSDEEIFELGYSDPHTGNNNSYSRKPYEISAYIQDKMEYDIMIINAGIRVDYFNSNTFIPDDLRNPSQLNPNPNFPGAGLTKDVDAELQVSPRLGISFPVSADGALHFSYGHFFQIPAFERLYQNSEYIIQPGQSLSSQIGNPQLKAEKTVKYELGLQKVIFPNVALDLTVYYNDIRNLLGMEILNTYEGFKYARFINKDYGNVKGLILTFDKRFSDFWGLKIDYTFQVAEGNSSDPMSVYNDNQSDPPVESEKKVVALNWDQASTVNIALNLGNPGDWNLGIIANYGSGTPYTVSERISKGLRVENGGRKPEWYNVDLKLDKSFEVGPVRLNAFLLVYNILDIQNETGVDATTGRANQNLFLDESGEVIGYNTKEQYQNNPTSFSSPRQIRLGVRVGF
ncbi:MAG: TonB-dependent receptor [Melioribacteraceae bacterium]|nr:TonB-dependent receptor [Melioribacteraceae bacterium]